MSSGLLHHAVTRIDQNQRDVGGARARRHVARVLHVSRTVGEDVATSFRGEVAIRHIDRDALLPLGAQAVREKREIGALLPERDARALDRLQLILEHRLRVV